MENSSNAEPNVEHELHLFAEMLKQNNYGEARNFFARNQSAGLFPKGEKLLPWLVTAIGEKAARKFTHHFVCAPCLYCRQGLKKCDNCDGKGHLGPELICDSCFSFGIKPCEFCAGTGLCTIDFVPPGLRFTVFLERIKTAQKSIKPFLIEQPAETSETNKSQDETTRIIQSLFDLNRQIAILETMSDVTKQLVEEVSPTECIEKIAQLSKKCAKTIILSKRKLVEIVTQLITFSKTEIYNQDSGPVHRRLFTERVNYLTALVESTPRLKGTFLEHSFLNKEIKRLGLNVE